MDCALSEVLCCMGPRVCVHFEHSSIKFSGNRAFIDIFCSVDRTVIQDNDYLFVTASNSLANSQGDRFFIMREPGNASGVARVMFPPIAAVYSVYYIRECDDKIVSLGRTIISLETPGDDFSTTLGELGLHEYHPRS